MAHINTHTYTHKQTHMHTHTHTHTHTHRYIHCTHNKVTTAPRPPPTPPPPSTRGRELECTTYNAYALLMGNPIPTSSFLESLLSRMVFDRERMSTSRCGKSVGVGGTGRGLPGVESLDILFFFFVPYKLRAQLPTTGSSRQQQDPVHLDAVNSSEYTGHVVRIRLQCMTSFDKSFISKAVHYIKDVCEKLLRL